MGEKAFGLTEQQELEADRDAIRGAINAWKMLTMSKRELSPATIEALEALHAKSGKLKGARLKLLREATFRVLQSMTDVDIDGHQLPYDIDRFDVNETGNRTRHQTYGQIMKILGYKPETSSRYRDYGMIVTETIYASPHFTYPDSRLLITELMLRKNDVSLFLESQPVSQD